MSNDTDRVFPNPGLRVERHHPSLMKKPIPTTLSPTPSPAPRAPGSARHKVSLPERAATRPANGSAGNGGSGSDLDPQQVLMGLVGLKKGDFSVRLPLSWCG